jgi:hypothetical protein
MAACDAAFSVIIIQYFINRTFVSQTSLPVIKISDRDCLGDRNTQEKNVTKSIQCTYVRFAAL